LYCLHVLTQDSSILNLIKLGRLMLYHVSSKKMISNLKTNERSGKLETVEAVTNGIWIRSERPSEEDKAVLVNLGVDEDTLNDALDPHEVPRLDIEDGWTYLITRLPDTDDDFNDYTTPMLFAFSKDLTVTVSRDSLGRLWQPFIDKTVVRSTQQTELFIAMVEEITTIYQRRVATINRQMRAATKDVVGLGSKDITTLTEYERKLNDYLDALIPTNTAIEKLLSSKVLKYDEDDVDSVEDLSIDFEQLIARCKSLLRTITNVRDSYRAVMDTRLNETIRLLTVITLAFTIPTMLAGLFGMNVPLPFDGAQTFWAVIGISVVMAVTLGAYFLKKR
jgi:magnesium transporter